MIYRARFLAWFGIAIGSGAMFVACANGTEATAPGGEDSGGGGGDQDATTGRDGSSFGSDGGGDTDGSADAGEDSGPSCIDDDAGCSTGSPGLCNGGNHHCAADGGSICVPLYTTQACYTGGATTRNKGICHDGTQSCVGALGDCEGESLPNGVDDAGAGTPVEDCFNNLDDDCDGLVNNGCPMSLSLTNQRTVTGAGGGGGGDNPVHCPAGAFITRVDSIFDDSDEEAAGVSIYCATPTLSQGASSYSITLSANAPAPYATVQGTHASSDVRADDCGISGLTGVANSVGLVNTPSAGHSYVGGLGHHCATSSVGFDPSTNLISFNFVRDGNTSFNDWNDSTGTFFNIGCASGEVMVGIDVHDGLWMDNIAPICATLTVNYNPGTPDP